MPDSLSGLKFIIYVDCKYFIRIRNIISTVILLKGNPTKLSMIDIPYHDISHSLDGVFNEAT